MSLEDSWPFSTPSASSGEAGAEVVFKDCPALRLQQREWTSPLAKARLGLLPLLLPAYSASSPVVFLEGPFTATSVGVKAQEGGEPWWQGQATCPGGGELPHPLLACSPRLSWGLCLSYDVAGGGTPHPTHLPMQVLLRHGHSPGALLGLTVTFLPELPARPSLLRWRYLRTLPTLSALLPTRVLSRHKDQRSDGFSLSLLLWGRGGKVPSSAISPQQPPSFTLDTAPPHHQASLPLLSPPRGSCSRGGSWFIPASPSP